MYNIDDAKVSVMIHELSKMDPIVIGTAYLYAMNYQKYGVNVTKEWLTATQQTAALDIAYHKGMSDVAEYFKRRTAKKLVDDDGNVSCSRCGSSNCYDNYCGNCGAVMEV